MVFGNRIEKCFHCLNEYVCGDCITNICPDCEKAGHKGFATTCQKCNEEIQNSLRKNSVTSEDSVA